MKQTTIQAGKESKQIKMIRKALLICGIISSLFYVFTDTLAAMLWDSYSYASQSVSELNAIGSPTRPLVVSLFIIYNILVIAFGSGVWIADSKKRIQRLTGMLIIGYAIVGLITPTFFPMHIRGMEKTISDTMHIILTFVEVLFIFFSIGFGATLHNKWFRIYSFGMIPILLLFGILAGADGSNVAAQLPTPWLGIKERINIFGYLLWIIVLAILQLREEKKRD
jgi:hypothetical protein